jgi:hypothetical protein
MTARLGNVRSSLIALGGVLLCTVALAPNAMAKGKNRTAPAKSPTQVAPPKPAEGGAEGVGDADAQTKVKVERGAGGKKVYKIEGEIVIEGKIQKPEAFYVLQKSSINYDWHELKQEFVPKILDSVTKAPF